MKPSRVLLFVLLSVPLAAAAQQRWWMDDPVRLIQTNLRETDTALDAAKLVQQLDEFPANALLIGLGGIVAHYPTDLEFHYRSPHLPAGHDMFGEVLREAHARGIRVIGRFDLSKSQKAVYDAHPEWFFKKASGEAVFYNGLYSTCINAGYYRDYAMKILTEALERYEVDGLFFNMFGNPRSDYSGNPIGLCHCDSCRRRFRDRYGRDIPERPDADYDRFMEDSREEVAKAIGALIHKIRPNAAFCTYMQDYVDVIMSESNTAVSRPLPMWPYSASDNVSRARNSQPDKMAFSLSIGFVDIPYRFVTVPGPEIELRQYQNMAHGAGPTFVALGTLDQQDRGGLLAARPAFQWHKDHEDLYVKQQSAARVLLLYDGGNSYRGLFRLLSEQHIPFAASQNFDWITKRPREFDLVVSPHGVPAELEPYIQNGGRVLAAGAVEPGIDLGKIVRRWTETRSSYFRVHDHFLFPSLKNTELVFLDGNYLEMEPQGKPLLTLIPPSMFGPPEKVHIDWKETDKPGVILKEHGKGKVAFLPWDIGGMYYRHSSPGHGGIITDLIDYLLPDGRQLKTNAHPLVEITVMTQPGRNRTLVHFVNLSGHSQTAYFQPLAMRDLEVELKGKFKHARATRLAQDLPLATAGEYKKFKLPVLEAYEAVVLEYTETESSRNRERPHRQDSPTCGRRREPPGWPPCDSGHVGPRTTAACRRPQRLQVHLYLPLSVL
jgi:hypothetical protein